MDLISSTVIQNKKLNYKFRHLIFKVESGNLFRFLPGQFVTVQVGDKLFRSYSIASAMSRLPEWEILLDTTPDGPGCKFLKKLKPGQVIKTTAPRGVFSLKSDGSKSIILGATGCGMASIKPILTQLMQTSDKDIFLFWGLRYEKDIFHRELLEDFTKTNPHFHYEIILSRPQDQWGKKTGYITGHILELIQNLPRQKTSLYLCGNNKMITEVNTALQLKGFPEEKIYFERHY